MAQGCELLLFVKDWGAGPSGAQTGNPAIDCKTFKQGDVLCVQPFGWGWGDCELGGATWQRSTYVTLKRTVTMNFQPGTSFADVKEPVQLVNLYPALISKSFGDIVQLDSDVGLPANVGNLAMDSASGITTFDAYQRVVTGFETAPMSEHPLGNHNHLRIIQLPNVSVAQASNLLSPELDVDPKNPSPYLQIRGFFIDKTKIPVGVLATYLADDLRTQPKISMPYTAVQIQNVVSKRTPIPFVPAVVA